MRYRFDTVQGFGKITHTDFIHNPVEFFPEPSEQEEALARGLLPDEANPETPEPWFASRSTRIVVDRYAPTKTVKKLAKLIEVGQSRSVAPDSPLWERMLEIYEAYNRHKGFNNPYSLKTLVHKNIFCQKLTRKKSLRFLSRSCHQNQNNLRILMAER